MDHDVIFGLLAVQLGFASPQDVVKAAASGDKDDGGLAARLQALELLSPDRRKILQAVVDETLAAHGNDVEQALATLGGRQAVMNTFTADSQAFVQAVASTMAAEFEQTVPTVNIENAAVTQEQAGRYDYPGGIQNAEIGRGGIGKVLVAYDNHLGREIAVKELIHGVQGAADELPSVPGPMTMARISRFLLEARVTGQLEHPNIVPVYEVGARADGGLYYSMRLVRGKNFHEALGQCETLHDRLKLLPRFVDLCQAIAYAHSRGVIHRDIKPHNVMVGEFGETVVLDWGLAKVRGSQDIRGPELEREIDLYKDAKAGKTVDGTAVGTPAYMSPEQARGSIDDIDERSDVWSLGVVLYQILTGQPPFIGGTPFEVIEKVLKSSVTSPTKLDPMIPPDLASVCAKALRREPEDRYQSAKELAEEIESYRAGGRIRAYGYTSWELIKRLVAQNRALSGLVATLVVVLVAGAAVIFSAYREAVANRITAETETSRAVQASKSESEARHIAETEERQAHLNLAIAYQAEAGRLIKAHDYMGGRVFAAAALLNNPHNRQSPRRYPEGAKENAREGRELVATQHSHIFNALVHRLVGFEWVMKGHTGAVTAADFSPDGTLLVTSGLDKKIKLWSVPDRSELVTLSGHSKPAFGVALSPNGRLLASASEDKTVRLWDIEKRSVIATTPDLGQGAMSVDFAPDGTFLVAGLADKTVRLFSVPDLTQRTVLKGNEAIIRGVAISPDGQYVAAAGMDESVRVWSVVTGEQTAVAKGEGGMVLSVAFSPDAATLAASYFDGRVRLFSAKDLHPIAVLEGHEAHVISVTFSPDGRLLASGGHDGRVLIWRTKDLAMLAAFRAHPTHVRTVRFSPDGRLLATASLDGTVRIWGLHRPQAYQFETGHEAAAYQLLYSPDGKYLISAALDGAIALWSREEKTTVAVLKGHESYVSSLALSPDGTLLASASRDSTVRLWSVPLRKQIVSLTGHIGRVNDVAFSAEGTVLATAGDDGVKLWSVAEKTEKRHLHSDGKTIWSLAFSPISDLLVSGDEDGVMTFWDSKSMEQIRQVKAHGSWLTSLDFSPDGKRLVSASKDATAVVWDVEKVRPVLNLDGHIQWVNVARFSPDGRLVMTGSDDNSARIWDAIDGKALHIHAMPGEVSGMAFAPEGNSFALAHGTQVQVYPVLFDSWVTDPAKLLELAQRDAGMELDGFVLKSR